MLKSPLSARPVIEALEARIAPATFIVTTTADSGPGSLRQAILDANALSGADTISFDISGDQLQVISLHSPLPTITDKVSISTLQSWGVLGEKVRIDGTNAGPDAIGLKVESAAADESVIAGLQIANFSASGIVLDGTAEVKVVANTVFGNQLHGLHIKGGTYGNNVYGNTFGVSGAVAGSEGNGGNGIFLENSIGNLIAPPEFTREVSTNPIDPHYANEAPNLINGNGLFGIEIRGGESNTLAYNEISNNGDSASPSNPGGGVGIFNSKGTAVGKALHYEYLPWSPSGAVPWHQIVSGNTISANLGHGILVHGPDSTGTQISGNKILANISGDGVHINGAIGTTFGAFSYYASLRPNETPMIFHGNTISQNSGWGVAVVNLSSNTLLEGGTIEDNAAGTVLFDHALNSTVKDVGLRSSLGAGVVVKDSTGVSILGNRFAGTGLFIDLGGDGATANDPGDADLGTNHLQNYPTLVVSNGQVTSTLSTDAINTKFRIQLYHFDSTIARYVPFAAQEVTTALDGTATLVFNNQAISAGQKYYATATNLTTNETSELSAEALVKPQASINSLTTAEGNAGVQNLTFTVTLDHATTVPVKVGYRSTDDTAKVGEDYGGVEGFLVFEPGETSKTITVSVFGDAIQETSEKFYIDLTTVENGLLSTSSRATGLIVNDDALPVISIQNLVTAEGVNPSSTLTGYSEVQYTVTLSNASLDPVTVQLQIADGTAISSSDYLWSGSSTITFAPGTTTATKTIYIKNDTTREETETIQLSLSDPTAGTLGNANAVLSIVDDDTWMIQADAVQLAEGNDGQIVATMKVRLVNAYRVTDHAHPISVGFATENGTATAVSDYLATQGTLTFQPGELEKTISIPIVADSVAEQNESFWIRFSSPSGANLQQTVQSVAILNDDPGTVSVSSASITEGHSGQKSLVFTVNLSIPTNTPVSVSFETQAGTALAGVDFEAIAGQLTFAPGETQKTITVPILGDRLAEQNEIFTLKLTDASGATIATATATGTILNDDPLISVESAEFMEGQPITPGTRSVFLPVRLSQATDIPVSVNFTSSNGSAEAPSDYIAASGTLTFAAGQTLQYIELRIVGDLTFEPDETFSVTLSNAQGASIGTDTGIVTIKSDEPFISTQAVTLEEGQSGTKSLVFTVTLSQVQNSAVTVAYATADGTATAGNDYTAVSGTLTFAPGETTKTVMVPIQGDTEHEANETLRLLLSEATGAALAQSEVIGTILNDDVSTDGTNLVISKGGRKATWTDSDGDLITLVATKPILELSSFIFGNDAQGNVVLQQLDLASDNGGGSLGLSFSVKKSATGDGLVAVSEINAAGRDLTTLSLPGRLGAIAAGDDNLKTPAIRKLTVNSFGMDSATAQAGSAPLLSEVKGSIGSFVVKQDFAGAHFAVSGGSVQSLSIGGDLQGISASAPNSIIVGKNLGALKVGGNVTNSNVVTGTETRVSAHVGQVLIKGNWSQSNLVVGTGAGEDGLYGTEDDIALQDTASRIAKITIRGAVSGTTPEESVDDHFGFVAGRIAAFQVGAQKLALSSKWQDSMAVGSTSDVMLHELTGRVRP